MRPLTQAEKVVWAVTFAIVRDRGVTNVPSRYIGPGATDNRAEWEEMKVLEAIEHASEAVEHLREAGPEVLENFVVVEDDGSTTDYGDVFAMWCDVTETGPQEVIRNAEEEDHSDAPGAST